MQECRAGRNHFFRKVVALWNAAPGPCSSSEPGTRVCGRFRPVCQDQRGAERHEEVKNPQRAPETAHSLLHAWWENHLPLPPFWAKGSFALLILTVNEGISHLKCVQLISTTWAR